MTDRIQTILSSLNLTPSQLADEISVQRSSLSHILSGRNKPSLDFVTKVLTSYPQINPEWLLFGKGSMLRKEDSQADVPDRKMAPKKEKPAEQEAPAKVVTIVEKSEAPATRAVPGRAAGGSPCSPAQVILLFDDGTFRTYSSARSDS